ncbi:threonine aldolase [Emydomyces testavorans]|uniref:Threonine aldolase n=1 Tax=Emydomyces testavorans TaxID=2070801 RepID=A0AAF0DI08_9EURO|nr:threonine aldolase [Emydomyces testavorans]
MVQEYIWWRKHTDRLSSFIRYPPHVPRIHSLTSTTAGRLSALGYTFSAPVQTNVIILDLDAAGIPIAAFVDYLTAAGLQMFPTPKLVFYSQMTEETAEKLIDALGRLITHQRIARDLAAWKDGRWEAYEGVC